MRTRLNQGLSWLKRQAPASRDWQPRPRAGRVGASACWQILALLLAVATVGRFSPAAANAWDDNPAQSRTKVEGEDIGAKRMDPLREIRLSMADVQVRLRDGDTSQATRELQRSIADGLSKLIEQQSESTSQNSAAGSQAQRTRPDSGQRPGGTASGQGTTASSSGGPANTDVLFRQIWGQLPDQVRQQMETPLHEKFLPQYDDLIQSYFKRLADDNPR